METIENLLYLAVRELAYVQDVENCNSELCASAAGKDLVERGMKALGVTSLEEETLTRQRFRMLPTLPEILEQAKAEVKRMDIAAADHYMKYAP